MVRDITCLLHVMRRFFRQAADVIGADHPVIAEKFRAGSHWTSRTHETCALAREAELTTLCDNLRMHRSRPPLFTCERRTGQISQAFAARKIAGPHRQMFQCDPEQPFGPASMQ